MPHPWYDGTIADFTEVRFLDAAGLRALVQAYKVLAQAGKALKVFGAQGLVARVLAYTHSDQCHGSRRATRG